MNSIIRLVQKINGFLQNFFDDNVKKLWRNSKLTVPHSFSTAHFSYFLFYDRITYKFFITHFSIYTI